MTPAELRALRGRVITPTDEEVCIVLEALRRWTVRKTEFGDSLSLWFNLSQLPAAYDLLHASDQGYPVEGSLKLLVRESALYNALSRALDRMRDDGFAVEVRYQGAVLDRLPAIGNASATEMATDANLTVTVSWSD